MTTQQNSDSFRPGNQRILDDDIEVYGYCEPREESDGDDCSPISCMKLPAANLVALLVAAALVVFLQLPFLNFTLNILRTLLHELGHTLVAWFYGFPSLPAFDFIHGGGVTLHSGEDPNRVIQAIACLAFLYLIFVLRRLKIFLLMAIATFAFLLTASIKNLSDPVILYAGHGTVLFMAGIFAFRGLGDTWKCPSVEKAIYLFLACFMILSEISFAHQLLHEESALAEYLDGKGGIPNDFVCLEAGLGILMDKLLSAHLYLSAAALPMSYLVYVIATWEIRRWRRKEESAGR